MTMQTRVAIFACVFLIGLLEPYEAVKLPPNDFLGSFMNFQDVDSVLIHAYLNKEGNFSTLIKFRKAFRHNSISFVDPAMSIKTLTANTKKEKRLQLFPSASDMIERLSESFSPNSADVWLINSAGFGSPAELAELLPLSLTNEVFFYSEIEENIPLYEGYKINPDDEIAFVSDFGRWSKVEKKLIDLPQDEIWRRRKDLQGLTLKVATLNSPPYITSMVQNGDGEWVMEGMFAEVFHSLQHVLNFSYTLQPSVDGEWGAISSDGVNWSGMVGMLQRKDIDIAATDFTVTQERSAVMTFAQPITQIYHSLFIKNPSGSPHFSAYSEPLHWQSWTAIFILIIATPPLLWIAINFGGAKDESRKEFTFGKSYVYAASMLTFARSWGTCPSTLRGRVAFGSVLVGGTLIFYHWEAMLISYLATRVIVLPFKSLSELMSESEYKISVTPGSSYADSFKHSHIDLWKRAWKERIEPEIDTYPKGEGHADKVIAEPEYALYDNYFAVVSYTAYANCEIIAIPKKYDFKPYAYGFQKDSALLPLFNFYLKQMREGGTMKQILEKFESRPQICPDYSGKAIGFNNCFTAFLCLILGTICAIITLCLESTSRLFDIRLIPAVLTAYERLDDDYDGLDVGKIIGILREKDSLIEYLQNRLRKVERELDLKMRWSSTQST